MNHDQLAKVFPGGRTVHVPTDGVPLKGYELARADIEKRGNGDDASTIGKPGFFASLFKGKSNDDEDEAASPAVNEKPATAAAIDARSADPVPVPRAKPPPSPRSTVLPPRARKAPASPPRPDCRPAGAAISGCAS